MKSFEEEMTWTEKHESSQKSQIPRIKEFIISLLSRQKKQTLVEDRYELEACKTLKYEDVSEIVSDTWIDYLVRMSTANMKVALGRSRSKYTIEGSNVSLDGDTLLSEANAELEAIRSELDQKKQHLIVLN